jgi:sacsin
MPALRFAHPKLSSTVAESVGVASVRRLLLAASADTLSLGLVAGAAEVFGQSEALTTRLRHIIQDYPEGPGKTKGQRAKSHGYGGNVAVSFGHMTAQ